MTKYLLLMRHGKHEAAALHLLDTPVRKLSADGLNETVDVVKKLHEVLTELRGDEKLEMNLTDVWNATTSEVVATKQVVSDLFNEMQLNYQAEEDLNPTVFKAYRNTGTHKTIAEEIKTYLLTAQDHAAVMVIGHQPLLSWLAYEVTGKALPLTHSEIACIAFDNLYHKNFFLRALDKLSPKKKGYLRWVLSPSSRASRAELAELKAKIKSKMGIARSLGATITVVLAFLLGYIVDEAKIQSLYAHPGAMGALRASTVLFFIALALFLATIYAYDRLLMPIRFWGEAPLPKNHKRPKWLVWRPPSSSLWVLYQNMMRVWRYLFTGATGAVILGFVLLAYAVFHPGRPIVFFAGAGTGLVLFLLAYKKLGPHLGSED